MGCATSSTRGGARERGPAPVRRGPVGGVPHAPRRRPRARARRIQSREGRDGRHRRRERLGEVGDGVHRPRPAAAGGGGGGRPAGLDVTAQAGILDLLGDLSRTAGMATIMITHDLAVVAERCDRIVVMHAGHVVEQAPARTLFARPRHPYTARLLASTPRAGAKLADLTPIPGAVPDLRGETTPCRYRTRCERAAAVCDRPPLPREVVAPGHVVACARPL